ncbi:MAG: Gfo/Idh/MocA family oxidoreductase [Clostridia bacterium]|nr:Gfo/Idh/MocA family oxidoreductase [Clostridia bacterium]
MDICKVGVIGVGRGTTMMDYCKNAKNAKLVAICDKWELGLENRKKQFGEDGVKYYTDFDEMLKDPEVDTVMLANYATEHAPFAIKALRAGKNVISEVLPAQTMAQAVELIETVEETGKKYCYAENYCYMLAPYEMKRKFASGEMGEFEYGEGEYMHNCESIWTDITYGERDHWRNRMSAFYYCTHSAGPLIHISGKRPVKVVGFECPFNARMARMGARAGHTAIEMVTLENGAVIKSLHGLGPAKCSIWYSVYGTMGRLESAREDACIDGNSRLYTNIDTREDAYDGEASTYIPEPGVKVEEGSGHGGSDYVCLCNAFEHILGHEADIVDVYEALDMWMIGQFGYYSVLDGGVPKEIPDLRLKSERDKYRNDRRCTEPAVAGDQLIPSYSKGTPEIPDEVYERTREEWERKLRGDK